MYFRFSCSENAISLQLSADVVLSNQKVTKRKVASRADRIENRGAFSGRAEQIARLSFDGYSKRSTDPLNRDRESFSCRMTEGKISNWL